jgi:hypothetical protein
MGPANVERKDREARKASAPTDFFATFARFAFHVRFLSGTGSPSAGR